MNKQTKKNMIVSAILILIGLMTGIVYWVWVQSIALPIKGELQPIQMESVSNEMVQLENGKIRLFTFVEDSCNEECHQQFEQLQRIQTRLKEYGSFVDTVEIVSVARQSPSVITLLEQMIDRYGVDPKGWHMLVGMDDEIESLARQLNHDRDMEGTVYLVDAKGIIRQNYDLTKGLFVEDILNDITQLIRLQQQSLDQ